MFAGKKVSFNSKKQMRAFEKSNPSNNVVQDFSMDMENGNGEDEDNLEGSDDMLDLDDEDDEHSSSSASSDDEAGLNFGLDEDEEDELDSLSPEEQLRILMAPVEDGDELSSDEEISSSEEDDDANAIIDAEEEAKEFDTLSCSSSDDDHKLSTPLKATKRNLLADEEEENLKGKSKFQKQQEKLKKEIEKLEQGSIGERPWMLKGEVDSTVRPVNSLLEEFVDFEHTSKPAPILTEELANSLDELIKQRIRDSAFDDVDRRDERLKQQRQLMMNRRKTEDETENGAHNDNAESSTTTERKNLSQVYEEEYEVRREELKKANATPEELKILSNASKDPKVQKAHSEITALFTKLCRKIDSLSNFKFSPPTYQSSDLQITPLSKAKEKEKYKK